MAGPARKQRKPTIPKPTGLAFKSISELKSKEEETYKTNKIHKYVSKKKVILLPAAKENYDEK